MPAPHSIMSPALAQAEQDHLILLGDTKQLLLSLFLTKATIKNKLGF